MDLTGIRISVTQRCNLNCIYCHKEGSTNFGDTNSRDTNSRDTNSGELPLDYFSSLISLCPSFGIKNLKITGGEPTMRRDLEAMVRLGAKWMDEVSMTTNGTLMTERRSKALSDAGLNRINVSLDSFENYQKITGGEVSVVVENLKSASRFYDPIKINMVLLKGMNEDELFDMIHFCRENSYILQLIELIPFTPDLHDLYLDLAPVEEWLSLHAEKIDIRAMHNRKKYFLDGAEIEVVKPMHNSRFCPNCKRIRVTSDGKVKPCLMRNDNLVDGLGAFKREGIGGLERSLREGINRRTPFWSLDDRHIGERAELEKSES